MPNLKLTARGIDSLRIPDEPERQIDYTDQQVPGLSLRVFASGRRSWYLRYRTSGAKRRYKLGDYPGLGLAAARKKAEKLRVAIRDGHDPVKEGRARRDAESVGDLFEWYLSEHASKELAPKTLEERERILRGKDLAALRKLPARDVDPSEIAYALDPIERRGSRVMLNRTQTALSAVFNWAAVRRRMGVVQNPVKALPRRSSERSRTRVLDAEELQKIWTDLDRRELSAAAPLRLVLVTAQRPGEVAAMEWSHLDLESGLWRMPKHYRKKPRGEPFAPPHDVPLSSLAIAILDDARRLRGRKYVFPTVSESGHLRPNGLSQAARRIVASLAMDRWTPHDLRRTAATHMTGLGIDRHVVDRVLGHKDPTVLGVYDRTEYLAQRRHALDRWAETLCGFVRPERERATDAQRVKPSRPG